LPASRTKPARTARALDEEGHGRAGGDGSRIAGTRRRQPERRDRVLALARHAKRRAARRQHVKAGRGGEHGADDQSRLEDLLQVIEHEQGRPLAQVLGERVGHRLLVGRLQSERARDRRRDQRRVAHGREVDEGRAAGVVGAQLGRGGDGQARLARAARAGEGQQADVGSAQERAHLRHLALTADQPAGWREGAGGGVGGRLEARFGSRHGVPIACVGLPRASTRPGSAMERPRAGGAGAGGARR
jgi:hypothetical protein